MPADRLAAFARVREEVASSSDRVRAICARHGVPWQAFYKHAKRQGWGLRQRAQRKLSALGQYERLRDIVHAHIAELAAMPLRPAPRPDIMRLAQQYATMLRQLDGLERRERDERNAARRAKRAAQAKRRLLLAQRISALGREEEDEEREAAEADADVGEMSRAAFGPSA
jgi:hypothetical protein